MDNVGRHIRMRLQKNGKVLVRMVGQVDKSGKPLVIELFPVDAREAIETGRGKLFGPALNPMLKAVERVKRELTEEEIVEEIDELNATVGAALSAQGAPQAVPQRAPRGRAMPPPEVNPIEE